MDPFATRRIGRTDVEVTLLGLGGGTLGDPDEIISEAQAEATLEAAYDDAGGATADFNYNLVSRINADLNGDLDVSGLKYHAHWNPYRSRVEMYLQAVRDMTFTVAGKRFVIREHETIHTENSHKFTVSTFQDLAVAAGFAPAHVWVSKAAPFSIHWLEYGAEA